MKNVLYTTTASLLLLTAISASAKTYFDESSQKALVYYSQGQNVNASVCEQVSEQELRRALQDTLKTKCTPLSANGLSKEDIEAKLPDLKKQMLTSIGALGNMMNGMGAMTGDKDAQNLMSGMMSGLFDQQKKAIENLTADQVFQQYQVEAKVPTLEKTKKPEDLDTEVEQFVLLTTK